VISGWCNGSLIWSGVDSALNTATKVGIYDEVDIALAVQFANFYAQALGT